MTEVQGETATALGISVSAQISQVRQVVFQTHVAADASKETLDALLDKLHDSADRTEAFYQIPVFEQELKTAERILADLGHRLETVEGNAKLKYEAQPNRRGSFKLSAQEEVAKVQATEQIRIQTRAVAECKQRLADTIKKAGTRYAGSTDSPAGVPDRKVP